MKNLISKLKSLHKDQKGLETIEYALMAALVAVAIITGAAYMGNKANDKYTSVGDTIDTAGGT